MSTGMPAGETSEQHACKQQLELYVTDAGGDVRPGQQLALEVGDGEKLCIAVPTSASVGDKLLFFKDDTGSWKCRLEVASPATPISPSDIAVAVPGNAIPGVTELEVGVPARPGCCPDMLRVTVPQNAVPGDTLLLTLQDDESWSMKIMRGRGPSSANLENAPVLQRDVLLGHVEVDAQHLYSLMVAAASASGANVSPKLVRCVGPSGLCGMLAKERIEAGEELMRIPSHMHISLTTCRRVMPSLCRAVAALREQLARREDEATVAACVARLLAAVAREAWPAADKDAIHTVPELWSLYCKALLAEPFELHPYWRCLCDGAKFHELMSPSLESHYMARMCGDISAVRRVLAKHVAEELLGPDFDNSFFLQARLSMLTRIFNLPTVHNERGESSLVPIIDFFNHSHEHGVSWKIEGAGPGEDADNFAMVVCADRIHEPGEEVYVSYGRRSNVMLFRTYGFTLSSRSEPACSFVDQHDKDDEVAFGGFRRLLPDSHRHLPLHLEAPVMQDSFRAALTACKDFGNDPMVFLREICDSSLRLYETDPALRSALDALQRMRAKEVESVCWWLEFEEKEHMANHSDEMAIHAFRVKMSEYVCLLVHSEAVELLARRLSEDRCLAASVALLPQLKEACGHG